MQASCCDSDSSDQHYRTETKFLSVVQPVSRVNWVLVLAHLEQKLRLLGSQVPSVVAE